LTRLQGARVALRELRSEDADFVVAWRRDHVVASQLFSPPPQSVEQHVRWFDAMKSAGDRQEFVITRVDVSPEQPIGTTGLSGITTRHKRAEFGIMIGEATARGQGFATEATRLLLDYAFGALALRRVFLQTFADNEAALNLYKRIGFVEEGRLRAHAVREDEPVDVVVMGLLVQEYRRNPAP
jgi:RimJ/RimL family protein N-acetyltransferase